MPCIRAGYYNSDYNLANHPGYERVDSPHTCQRICQGVPDCKSFTYTVAHRLCVLKTDTAGFNPTGRHLSAAKFCP